MGVATKLENLTLVEKISVMEYLWDDLCCHASEKLSPPWHGEVLAQRQASITEGSASFVDWEEAKKKIRESL